MIKSYKTRFQKFSALLSDPEIAKYARQNGNHAFSRKRKMPLKDMLLCCLSKKGLTTTFELRNYFKEKGDLSMQLSVQGYLQQRKRLNPEIFPYLNRKYLMDFYRSDEPRLWKGYLLIAIDGSKAEVPNSKDNREAFGNSGNQHSGKGQVRALVSGMYDVLNHFYLDIEIEHICISENELAKRNLKQLKKFGIRKPVVAVFDRGYPSLEFIDFLETEDDVLQLVDNIFDNTTDKEARKGEQIWDDSAKSLLRALIFYVREMLPKEQQNFTSVMRYLRRAKTEEDEMGNPKPSQLDGDMLELQRKLEHDNKKADSHPAYRAYQEYRSGAAKTMQSVLFTLNARLSKFNVQSIADLTSQNELELKRMGREKIAIFAVIPDDNQSYNFLVGMLYTQLFQQLYRSADDYRGKKLPVPVHFLMDEFANVALPKSFESLLSTMRQRQIFCSIILQNLSQLKALYEKQWESIVGNCDSFLYLGGNEQSTFEYVSKRLGTETIDIDSYSQSKGRNGSSSKSTQLQKRELMLPDEVGRLDNKYAIYIMRGENPILDLKYDVFHHPNFSEIALGGAESYHYSEEKIAEREQRQRTWDLQEREAIQRKNTAELDAFFHDHAAEDGSIELNLDELDYSSEELMQYAASLMHTGKEKAQ